MTDSMVDSMIDSMMDSSTFFQRKLQKYFTSAYKTFCFTWFPEQMKKNVKKWKQL